MIYYKVKNKINPKEIGILRNSVGWNGMESYQVKSLKNSYFYISCYEDTKLIGFLDVVSNQSTDAYIQDVIVNPEYQGKGIGTQLMNMAIGKLKENNIYMISVLFEDALMPFYKKFGFNIMKAGQLETHYAE